MENSSLPYLSPTKSLVVIRGRQAGREYFMAMCQLSFVAQNLSTGSINMPTEKIIQRPVNKARIPKIAEYLIDYHDDYILPPIIASIDGNVRFEPISAEDSNMQVGMLHIPESCGFIINDGQHRCAAIKQAIMSKPELKRETIGVVFYIDRGVKRARQIFSDLNGHPVRTNQNINATFDSRQYLPKITKLVIDDSKLLNNRVELLASGCAIGSPRLFTISAVNKANGLLLDGLFKKDIEQDSMLCLRFWHVLELNLPGVKDLLLENLTARQIKEKYFYCYSIGLQSLAGVANYLIKTDQQNWESTFGAISSINWQRDNAAWEGRAMSGGRLTTGGNHPTLTLNYLKRSLGLKLSNDEQVIEDQLKPLVGD